MRATGLKPVPIPYEIYFLHHLHSDLQIYNINITPSTLFCH